MLEKVKAFWKEHWMFLCILILATGLRLLYAAPGVRYVGTDLSLQAYNLLQGRYDLNLLWYHLGVRYTILLLVAGVYALFGISEFTSNIIPFCASLGTIILIYFLGRSMFSKHVGLLAAFFLAILPLDIFNATVLETDSTMNFFAVAAMFLYYHLRTKEKKFYFFVFVGIIIAISAFAKIFGILILFCIGLYEILSISYKSVERNMQIKRTFFRLLAIGIGFALIYCPVLVWQYTETGDFLYNIHVEKYLMYAIPRFEDWPKPNYDFIPTENDFWTYPEFMLNPTVHTDFLITRPEDGTSPMLNIFFYFIFPALLYFLYKREQKITFLLCWFLLTFLFLQQYYFIVKIQRYLTITLVPAFLLTAYFITILSQKFPFLTKKAAIFLVMTALFFLSIYQLGEYTILNPYAVAGDGEDTIQIATFEEGIAYILERIPERDTYITNYQTVPLLNFYLEYSKNYSGPHGYTGPTNTSLYDLHFVRNYTTNIHNAYVIIEPSYYRNDLDVYSYYAYKNATFPIQKQHIPETWQLVYQDPMKQFIIFYAP